MTGLVGFLDQQIKALFTWREEDHHTRKIRKGGTTFRWVYMQKFGPSGYQVDSN